MFNTAGFRKFDQFAPGDVSEILHSRDEFLLLREMNHRLANTFSVLRTVLQRDSTLFASSSPQESPLTRFETRIAAFSKLHKSLSIGASDDYVSIRSYVENLCKALSEAVLEPLGICCEVSADTGELSGERCELLGLVITELVLNAAKYAFHNREDGLIRVALIQESDSWLCIIADNGEGSGAGLAGGGSKIINQLIRALGGQLAKRSTRNGTLVVVSCPGEVILGSNDYFTSV